MRRKGLFAALPFLIILTVCSIIGIVVYVNESSRDGLIISHESGIYDDSFELWIENKKPGKILYTVNGEEPAMDNENSIEYTEPLWLICSEITNTYSFQICCFYDDGTKSDVYRRDFILDYNGKERFSTTYVVSIVGDEEKLFGDEEGIFVRGNQFYEYVNAHPDVDVLREVIPANYHEDIEVPVHTAFFLQNGEQIIDQNCGIKIYGNGTRQHNQKSFRIIARYEYDTANEFCYPFFDDIYTENGRAIVDKYQRLSFHNSGDDNCHGFARNTLMGELARQTEYSDTLSSESVTVYINGKYQGVYWLQNTYDDRYFKEKYGDYLGEMVVCEGALDNMNIEMAETDAQVDGCESYNKFCEWISAADLSEEVNWEKVCNTIDVENFAHYFALEYYSANADWPRNNVKIYRYQCNDENDEMFRENTAFDGKWRFLLFDMDYSLGLITFELFGCDASVRRLESFLNNEESATIFCAMCKREEFKELFISNVITLMNTTFEYQNVSDTLYELNVKRYNELNYMLSETSMMENSIWAAWGIGTGGMKKAEDEWNKIVVYAMNRPQSVISELQSVWDCGNAIPMQISTENGDVYIKNMSIGSEFNGVWLDNVPLQIFVETNSGVSVKGYTVNSEYIEGEILYLFPEQIKQYSEGLHISPIFEQNEVESLVVVEYKLNDSQDYVILRNNGTVALNLNNYIVTDNENNLSKGKLPRVELKPEELFYIYGEKYSGKKKRPYIQVPFSWNDEEEVYLIHQQKGIIQ